MKTMILIFLFSSFITTANADIVSNLVGWWKFDEGSGTTTADSSGNGLTGTLTGSTKPAFTSTSRIGPYAMSYSNASASYVNIASPSTITWNNSTDITIALWVYWTNSSDYCIMFCKDNNGTWQADSKAFQIDATTQVLDFGGFGLTASTSTSTIPINTWTHVAVTYVHSSHTTTFYINGAAAGSGTSTTLSVDSAAFTAFIGYESTIYDCPGTMDDMRVYSRALSANDIKQLYQYTGSNLGFFGLMRK